MKVSASFPLLLVVTAGLVAWAPAPASSGSLPEIRKGRRAATTPGPGTAAPGEEEEVRLAVVMFRHGDRTPIHTFPTDAYKNPSDW